MRDQQDLDIGGHKMLKLSEVDYKINGMYRNKRNTRMSNKRLSKMNRQQTNKQTKNQANSRKNQIEF